MKRLHHKKRTAMIYVDRCKLDLLWWLFHNIYKYRTIMLHMWNSFNITSQVYLNKKTFLMNIQFNYSLNIHSEYIITLLLGSSFASKISTASSIAIHWRICLFSLTELGASLCLRDSTIFNMVYKQMRTLLNIFLFGTLWNQ